jgi:hypothetical protein
MRLSAALLGLLSALGAASATPRVAVRGEGVWLDGARAWRGSVVSPLVWSADGGAVAFVGRDARGRTTLVVVVPADAAPQVLVWPLPSPARAVTWLGPTRIGAGPSELEPRMVASFTVEK